VCVCESCCFSSARVIIVVVVVVVVDARGIDFFYLNYACSSFGNEEVIIELLSGYSTDVNVNIVS
jgi:hypothetical protein